MSIYIDGFATMFGTVNNLQGLKDKIIDNAVKGRLTERKINVDSATLLIEKANLIEEELIIKGLTKKSKLQNSIFEKPYELPRNWVWTTLGEITNQQTLNDGDWIVSSDMDENGEIKLIQLGSIGNAKYIDKGFKYINKSTFERIGCKAILPGYLLINRLIGDRMYACKMPDIEGEIITAVDVCWLSPQEEVYNLDYIMYAVLSTSFQNAVKEQGKGTTRLRISKGNLINIPFPLPPIEEQNEIVEKIKMLHNEVDQLEAKLKKKEHLLELLPQAVVDAIANSETEHQLKEQLEFVIENFESIFQTPESMQDLRNVILQLAIEGKLVPQDPTDEPASELLKKIKAEREQLVREKKIKKPAVLEPISEDEIPFEIPESWEWVRLGEVTNYGNNTIVNPDTISNDEWVLELEDIEKNTGKIHQHVNFSERYSKSAKSRFESGDVLYGKLRPYLRKILVAPAPGVCTTEIIAFRGHGGIHSEYIVSFLMSKYADDYVNSITHGMKMPRLGTDNALNLLFPLPPINEQMYIVQKVKSLMAIIDQLEQKLKKKVEIIEMLGTA